MKYRLFRFPAPYPQVSLDVSWWIVFPLSLWAIATGYVAILGAFLNPLGIWIDALLIEILLVLSIVLHGVAHTWAARALRSGMPEKLPLLLFGDAAQVWPEAASAGKEALAALAGPLASLLLAGLAFGIWNAQVSSFLNISTPFLAIFNTWLAVINLAPIFPLDGGRVARVLLPEMGKRAAPLLRWGTRLGLAAAAFLVAWSIFLFVQQSRYSLETGGATLLGAALLVIGIRRHPGWIRSEPVPGGPVSFSGRALLSGLLILLMLAAAASTLLTNNGLEAPGVALSVESMVDIPAAYRHTHPNQGTFILTSVISQAPIPTGLWLLGKVTPVIKILPPEKILPNQISPQEEARQGFEMLDQSEVTALAVGLQLAGYPATISGKGAEVMSVIPESHAQGILQPGDVITQLDGKPIRTQPELSNQLATHKAGDTVHITVERGQKPIELSFKLLPPATPDNPPRIGIYTQTAGFDASLPFPARIVPQKIVGGPSAGLMFTLTVYNALATDDLTGGRRIAGTGTINPDGTVGPIGGVQQKVFAAEYAGAEYFLSPPENYDDARAAATNIKVIKITTAKQAIDFLRGLR